MSDYSSLLKGSTFQAFFWEAAKCAFLMGQLAVATFSSSFSSSGSVSAVLLVLTAATFPKGSFGGGASFISFWVVCT